MKEPKPGKDGIVQWNQSRVADTLITELKSYGYQWNEEEEVYQLPIETVRKYTIEKWSLRKWRKLNPYSSRKL